MQRRSKSTGYRQHVWDALRSQVWDSVADLSRHVGASPEGLRGYVAALESRGYIDRSSGKIVLKMNTGARAPSWSVHTDEFRDWNLQPSMPGDQLKAIVSASGLHLPEWLAQNGFHANSVTRLRQMMSGSRPMSVEMERAARQSLALPGQAAEGGEVARG